jgi:hypothetical protein
MKKHFPGLIAITTGIVLSAFTTESKPFGSQNFFFDELSHIATQGNVENVTIWINSYPTCPVGARAACGILTVNDKYYHFQAGTNMLNTHSYITSQIPAPESGDLEMIITATQGNTSGTYIVSTTTSGSINNQP